MPLRAAGARAYTRHVVRPRPLVPMSTQTHTADTSEPLGEPVWVRRALISVSDKTGVADFAAGLAKLGIEIVSTGGTAETLHPRLHAALLAVRDDPGHSATLEAEGIEPIDLVCVNLYPFEDVVARIDVSDNEAIENIDIGGPTMIRAAAKNHRYLAVVVQPESYDAVLAELQESGGEISGETRHWLANEAFALTAHYDAAISRWFGARYEIFPSHLAVALERFLVLSRVAKLHGRALSFNNVLDLDGARRLLHEFDEPACVIVKHNNPCGVAVAETVDDAHASALACDPLSAFGGVVALNRPVGRALAERLHETFIEVLIAPGYEDGALEVLRQKEAIRILEDAEQRAYETAERDVKRVRGGLLVQDADQAPDSRDTMEIATEAKPDEAQWDDLLFAWRVARHVRSNAIVVAKRRATIGIGAGQMSRVDSVRIAVDKARGARGDDAEALLSGSVVASDAFFPFADGPEAAIEAGARAIIQPGGSVRDNEVIAACDAAGAAMVMTGR